MKILRSLALCISTFSRVPVPKPRWQDDNLAYVLAALPVVGVFSGLALWGWCAVSAALGFGAPLFASGLTLVPLAVSGGIHLDGFADTADALASHAPPEKKREILHDPRCGAFAVIAVGAYLLLYFGVCTAFAPNGRTALALGLVQILSRCAGSFASLCFPSSGAGDMLDMFKTPAGRGAAGICAAIFAAAGAAMVLLFPLPGAAALAACALCTVYMYFMSKKEFGGMSGDLAGWLIQVGELAMLAAFLLAGKAAV
ncbi:MAG: adenosylcobinamide-GDP ribazoletransferase [Oscillospiraceae bacterium]|nr:adenosylcobinamide-GDP ribazoletransferase [Oscillospiraceae bacterium]